MKYQCKVWPGSSEKAFPKEAFHWAPLLNVKLVYRHSPPTKWIEAIADTGAHCCLFHADFCHALGIALEEGIKSNLGGIIGGANVPMYFHQVKILIGSVQVQTMAGFAENLSVAALWAGGDFSTIFASLWMAPATHPCLKSERLIAFSFAFPSGLSGLA